MPVRPGAALRALLSRRSVAGRDAVEVARELVTAGCLIAVAGSSAEESEALIGRLGVAGLAASCEISLPVDRLEVDEAQRLGRAAADAGLGVVLAGPSAAVDAVDLPAAGVVVSTGEPGAEARCRTLAGGHVRLEAGAGRAATLCFVRCLNVLMAADGHPGVTVSDQRLIAIAGERAAWNGRAPDSWEYVMPFGVLIQEQRRLVAGGRRVRVAVPLGGRS